MISVYSLDNMQQLLSELGTASLACLSVMCGCYHSPGRCVSRWALAQFVLLTNLAGYLRYLKKVFISERVKIINQ